MTIKFRDWLTPPVFEGDEEKTRIARLNYLFLLVATFLVTVRALGVLGRFPETASLLATYAGIVAACLALLWLVRRGQVRLTVYLTAAIFWLVINAAAVLVGGVDRPMFSNNLVLLVLIAFTLGAPATAGFALASALAGAAMIWARLHGLLATPAFAADFMVGATTQIINVAAAGVYLSMAAHSLREALGQARQRARALSENEEHYRMLVDTARDVIFGLAPDSTFTSLNPSFESFTGWARAEWLGRSFEGLIAEADRPSALDLFNRVLSGETLRAIRLRVHTRAGAALVVELNMSPQMKDGRVVGILGVARDMTEEHRAEDALKASEARFRAMVENSWEAVALLSADGAIVYQAPSLQRLVGRAPEARVGQSAFEHVHPEDIASAREALAQILQTPGQVVTFQVRLQHQDGRWLWAEVTASNMLNRPEVGAVVVNTRDITERKQAEQVLQQAHADLERQVQERTAELSQTNALLQTLMDHMPDHIYFKDRDSRFIRASRSVAEWLGLDDPVQVLGRTDFDFFTEAHARPAYEDEQAVMRTGQPLVGIEEKETWPDGRETWVSTTKMPLRDPQGKIIGTFGISRDITEQRQTREALRTAKDELEIKVAERTAELRKANAEMVFELVERQRAQTALRESEARYRSLAEAAHDMIFIINRAGRVEYVNSFAAGVFGQRPQGVIGQPAANFFPPNTLEHQRRNLESVLETGQPVYAESRTPFGDRELWLGTWLTPLTDEAGAVNSVMGISRDITERKQAEEALHESQERFQSLSGAAFEGLMIHDRGFILDANQAFADLFGFGGPDELIGRGGLEILPLTAESREKIKASMGYSSAQVDEIEVVRGDGSTFPAETQGRDMIYKGRKVRVVAMRDITARKRAEEEIRRLANEFAELYQTSLDLAAQQDLSTVLQTIVERATTLLGASSGAIFLYDAERHDLEIVATQGYQLPHGTRLEWGEGMAGRVAQSRQPLIVDNYSTWEHRSRKYAAVPMTASVQVPMLYGGELIGVLDISELHTTTHKFTEADTRLLTLFAGQAAGAVHNARLFDGMRQRLAELQAVNRISTALRAAHTVDEMLPRLLDETLAVLDCVAGDIWLYDAANNELRQAVARGWCADSHEPPLQPGEGIAGSVFAGGEAYLTREFASDPQTHAAARAQMPPGWGGACVPIRTAAETVGVFFISVPLPREPQPAEAELLTTLAEIAGNAIHRMSLYAQTERRLQHIAALHTIDTAISASLDLRVTLGMVVTQVTTHLRVDAAAILLLSPHTRLLTCAAARGFRTNAIHQLQIRLGESHAGQAALERRNVYLPDLAQAGPAAVQPDLLAAEDFRACFAVPLIAKGQVLGVLDIFQRAPLKPEQDWLEFVETLAGQAGIAIDNAGLFEDLQRTNIELSLAYEATIEGWSRALDLRDKETEGHTQRVTEMTLELARALGMSAEETVHLRRGALLHDIGKMGVPDRILFKQGKLTKAEWEIMRQHPVYAYDMLAPITYLRPALDIPYCHHERWDGTGYPRGLRGDAIPLAARVFAIADVWDALCSNRPYRRAWPGKKVRDHLRARAGSHFDPQVVEVFLRLQGAA